ncbi:flagellar hook-associated protein FlgK [Shewanella baltica]|uniref:flagellar hook-associated protein FlgK n=1 Tax=Shewanella baltica TaxID=62322 RepID=UPI000D377166|nr:flagellar hook-associated protein FlgK [Shewanella baltica]
MAVDLLNIARTGVLASQSQLGVTSNNIANANTAGYHRQVATQSTLESQRLGNSFYGTGTYVNDVKRIYNDYAARELRIGQTTLSAAEASYGKLSELDQLFSKIGNVVPQSLNDLFSGMNSVADLPTDLGIRSSTLTNAQQVASSLNQMQSYLNGQLDQTNDQITGMTKRINEISTELANLNLELMKSPNQDAQLLDKQDALVQELSQYAQVNVIPQENGAKSIMLGGSVMLVSGEIAMSMGTQAGNPFPKELQLNSSIGSQSVTVDPSKLGGQLGAMFDFRDQTLIPAGHELDQLALGVADNFNKMQAQGIDLNGQVGANIFKDINDPMMSLGRVAGFSGNTGNATLGVTIDDTNLLTGGAYELSCVSTAPASYELRDTETGVITPLTLSGSTFGFSIDIKAGAMASGDRFTIRPTAGASNGIEVVMKDPKGITAASPKITADAANSGNTQVKLTQIGNRNAANFPVTGSELTIKLDTTVLPPTYEAFDAAGTSLGAATTYTPPSISAFGFTFEVDSSAAAAGDKFTFDLSFAEGDNSNAIAMAKLSETKVMNGGKSTLADVFENTKLDIGSKTKAAEVRVGSAEAVYQQAYARVESESGVNLDEEAANLMRFQQAYQASARIMTTAQEIFDTLLTSVR